MEIFNAFKGIEDDIGEAVEATMPRQAIVTRADDAGGVWVRFTPVDASVPEMWFPSNVSGLPAGTAGWVHPLAGRKGRFIADNVAVPIPFTGAFLDSVNTTSLTGHSYGYSSLPAIVLPAGTYVASGMATANVTRNTGSSNINAQMRINGVLGQAVQYGSATYGNVAWVWKSISMPIQITFTSNGSTPVEIGFGVRGHTDAGTTYLAHGVCHGTFRRIG